MDVHFPLDHELGAHPGAAASVGTGLLCPVAGALGQHQVFPLSRDDLSSLCVFSQRQYPDFELGSTTKTLSRMVVTYMIDANTRQF